MSHIRDTFYTGIPALIFVIYALRRLAEFERTMAIAWLHVDMRPMPPPLQAGLTWWERLRANLSDPVTWRSLAYLLTKFPLGILSLVITCTLFVLTVGLACVSLIVGLFAVLPLYFSGILSDRKMRRQLVLTSLNSLTETRPYCYRFEIFSVHLAGILHTELVESPVYLLTSKT